MDNRRAGGPLARNGGTYLMQVRTQQYDTVDALCWRHLKKTRDVVEKTLELNPGLADYGPVLPHGLLVRLPDVSPAPTTTPTLKLWE